MDEKSVTGLEGLLIEADELGRGDDGKGWVEEVEGAEVDGPGVKLRRLRRVETVLKDRIGRAVIVLERVSNGHNYAAILRTAEAMGFQHVYVISMNASVLALETPRSRKKKGKLEWKADDEEYELHVGAGRGATKWLTLHVFESATEALEDLRKNGFKIWATDLSQKARPLGFTKDGSQLEVPDKLAFVMGTEGGGVSQVLMDGADERVYLPMHGFADSFNVSVAAALMMQQLCFMCPAIVGSLPEEEKASLRKSWYQQMARNKQEEEEFMAYLSHPPQPFTDPRRSDDHRNPHMRPGDFKDGYVPGR